MKASTAIGYLHIRFEAHLDIALGPEWRRTFAGSPTYHKLFRAFNAGWKAAKEEPPPVDTKEETKKRIARKRRARDAAANERSTSDRPSSSLSKEKPLGEALEGLEEKGGAAWALSTGG